MGAWGLEAGGHTGYCWAVCLNRKEDSVRVTPLLPPALTQDEFNWNEIQKQRRSAEEVDAHLAHTEQARAADQATRQLLETGGSNLKKEGDHFTGTAPVVILPAIEPPGASTSSPAAGVWLP
eukprot:COSAG06_NODE_158_length_21760_cov_36.036979_14_plen_122_part_00